MKNILSALIGIVLIVCGTEFTVAAVTDERGYIQVSANASAEIPPDVAEIKIAVKTTDSKSMLNATNANKEISDKVYAYVKKMINPANGDYVKTANFTAAPIYTHSSNGQKSFDKYEVSNSIIVHTKNLDKTGAIIDKAISLGAANINDLEFSVSDYEEHCNDLIGIAARKAKIRAEIAAKSTSAYITGIKSMDISCSTSTANRVKYRLYSANMIADSAVDSAEDSAAATPVQSGSIKIFANLNASYFVK